MSKNSVATRGRPKKAPGEHHVAINITLPPADVDLLDEFVEDHDTGTRSAAIALLIGNEAERRARRRRRGASA